MKPLSFSPPKPVRLGKGNTYYFRLRIPTDLKRAGVYACTKNEIRKSLKTTDLKEAKARLLLVCVEVEQEFAEHRRQIAKQLSVPPLASTASTATTAATPPTANAKTATPPRILVPLSEIEIERKALLYCHALLAQDEHDTTFSTVPDYLKETEAQWYANQTLIAEITEKNGYPQTLSQPFPLLMEKETKLVRMAQERQSQLATGAIAFHLLNKIAEEANQEGLDEETQGKLARAYTKAEHKAFCIMLRRCNGEEYQPLRGDAVLEPLPLLPTSTTAPAPTKNIAGANPPTCPLFSALCEEFIQERKLTQGTLRTYRVALKDFVETCGDLPIDTYTRAHVRQYREAVQRKPQRLPRQMDAWTLPRVLRWVKAEEAKGRKFTFLTPKTINDGRLAAVAGVFKYALRCGFREAQGNPVEGMGIMIQQSKSRIPTRLPYTEKDIMDIVNTSILFGRGNVGRRPTGWKKGQKGGDSPETIRCSFRDYRLFFLLALLTGARMEELAHLTLDDVQERQGILCLSIHEDEGHTIKTKSAQRLVPVHPHLLALGFKEHVEALRALKEKYLLPTFPTSSQRKRGDTFGRWWRKFTVEVLGEERSDKKTFHSLRHTFKNHGINSGVSKAYLDEIQGHAENSVSANYALDADGMHYTQAVLAKEAMEKMDFWGIIQGNDMRII